MTCVPHPKLVVIHCLNPRLNISLAVLGAGDGSFLE